ncbi:alpha/beta hydrolase [Myxococcota bacterium]|nr:alpha/beta hydrolase [Myxococcota bacterium]
MPTLNLPDATVFFDQAGRAGPRVMMVQGAGVIGEGWRGIVNLLAGDHQLAWHDNRGVGRSLPLRGPVTVEAMAKDTLAVMDQLGWEDAHLVGHSLGGIVVQELAQRATGRARSLSLISTAGRGRDVMFNMPVSAWGASLRMTFGADRGRWLALAELSLSAAAIQRLGDDETIALLKRSFCEDFVQMPAVVRAQTGALWAHSAPDYRPLQGLPTLILTGSDDRTVHTRLSDVLHAALPQSRLVRMPGEAHALIFTELDAVSTLLAEHFADAEARSLTAPRPR